MEENFHEFTLKNNLAINAYKTKKKLGYCGTKNKTDGTKREFHVVFIVKSKLRNKQEIKMAKTKEISFKVCSNLSGELLLYLGGILCLFVFQKEE